MEKIKIILVLFTILFISSCTPQEEATYEPNVGESCKIDTDCKTPFEFLVQSNCPFGSACISNKCKVVCPFTFHDPNPNISQSYPISCEVDEDCDCSDRQDRTIKCVCHNNKCLSIEAE